MEKKSLWCSAKFTVIPVNLSQVQTDSTTTANLRACLCTCVCRRDRVCACVRVFLLPGVFLPHSSTFKHPRSTETQYKKQTRPSCPQTLYWWKFWLCAAFSEKKERDCGTLSAKCLCEGYTLGLSHSLWRDCSLRLPFALWYRKPCMEACSSAASLQQPRWGRDPERRLDARGEPAWMKCGVFRT